MKLNTSKIFVIVGIFIFCFIAIPSFVYAQNTITGTVFNAARRPATDVEIELLDEFERFVKSAKTRGSGLYLFNNLRAGIYYIRIRSGAQGYDEQKIRLQLGDTNRTITSDTGSSRTSGVEIKQIPIYLTINPRYKNRTPASNDVVYAQEIPKDAEEAYEKGIDYIRSDKNEQALAELLRATDIFPTYYSALMVLANEYLDLNRYEEAADTFDRAVKVNEKSSKGFFGLAVAQNSLATTLNNLVPDPKSAEEKEKAAKNNQNALKLKQEAAINVEKAIAIDPSSVAHYLMLGILQRDLQKYADAEQSLLKAKKLSENKEPDVHYNLGLLYFWNLKQYSQAADELELYLKASPSMPEDEKSKIKNMIAAIRKKAKQT